MEILKKYIANKRSITQSNSKALTNNQNKKPYFINDDNEALYLKNKLIIDRLEKFFEIERLADNYKNEIRKYFFGLFDYISKKGEKVLNIKKNKKSSKLMLNENSNKINISIVASFVNETFQNYQNETRNYILSKMRKYVRLLNNNFTQNFDFKITFKKNNKENTVLTYYELEYITSSFKKKMILKI